MIFDPPLDPGIRQAVEILSGAGVETFESCEGGGRHAYPSRLSDFTAMQRKAYEP